MFWGRVRAGDSIEAAAAAAGIGTWTGRRWVSAAGGVMPRMEAAKAGGYARLTFEEREQIAVWIGDHSIRLIARRLGRSPSTVSREIARHRSATASVPYLASTAQDQAAGKAHRAKPAKLVTHQRLRRIVQERLRRNHSPEQIAGWLRTQYPNDPEMRVSHETIYQALYVQSRGALSRELTTHLRTGRAVRVPRRRDGQRLSAIPDMVNISQRPPQVADRAVPGHWEGDLITGAGNKTAIGTLVERATGFVILLHLPEHHTAVAVQTAMIAAMADLPATLRRTLTWDQGSEMANHAAIAAATDLDIYFCDPRSPWQRGTNENTNGLLRQYFPKGTDLSVHGAGILANAADELNNRPRKRYGWATPAQRLDTLLAQAEPPGVALAP